MAVYTAAGIQETWATAVSAYFSVSCDTVRCKWREEKRKKNLIQSQTEQTWFINQLPTSSVCLEGKGKAWTFCCIPTADMTSFRYISAHSHHADRHIPLQPRTVMLLWLTYTRVSQLHPSAVMWGSDGWDMQYQWYKHSSILMWWT